MKKIISILSAMFACAAISAQEPPRIAVYVIGDISKNEKNVLGAQILSSLINSGRYSGIGHPGAFPAEIEKILPKGSGGDINDSLIGKAGQRFGVKFVCAVGVTQAYGAYQVSTRVINAETAETVFFGNAYSQLKSADDVVAVSNEAINNMFGGAAKHVPQKIVYSLTASANPSAGGTISRAPDLPRYNAGTRVTLKAVPAKGYRFINWTSGARTFASPSMTITMADSLTLSANFEIVPPAPVPESAPMRPPHLSGLEMVHVEGGTFTMGCTDEQGRKCYHNEVPAHGVTVGDFYIMKYEVTQKLWKQVTGGDSRSYFKGGDLPVENVNRDEIVNEFIPKLNALTGMKYRLPTEAEWEYAARGGKSGRRAVYAGGNRIGDVAWYSQNSRSRTQPIGTKQANELGIHDMSGNVWEWVSDKYGMYTDGSQTGLAGQSSGSIYAHRGGGFNDGARKCRVSSRNGYKQNVRYKHIGFRLALDAAK